MRPYPSVSALIADAHSQVSGTFRIAPLFLALVSLPALSSTVVFTNRAQWENAAGSLTRLSFPSGNADTAAGITSEGVNFAGRFWGSHIIGDFRNDPVGEHPSFVESVDGYRLFTIASGLRVVAEYENRSRGWGYARNSRVRTTI
jgi:hypothetical protein